MSLWGRWDMFKQTAKNIQTVESHAWSAEGVIQAVFPEGRNFGAHASVLGAHDLSRSIGCCGRLN